MGKYLPIHVFFQGEVQTLSDMMKNLCSVLIAIAHGTDT